MRCVELLYFEFNGYHYYILIIFTVISQTNIYWYLSYIILCLLWMLVIDNINVTYYLAELFQLFPFINYHYWSTFCTLFLWNIVIFACNQIVNVFFWKSPIDICLHSACYIQLNRDPLKIWYFANHFQILHAMWYTQIYSDWVMNLRKLPYYESLTASALFR